MSPAELSLDFVDIHGGVDGEIGIANGGARRRRQMPCRGAEFTARTFERVGITVALGARHGKRIGGDEFVERSAMAIRGDVAALDRKSTRLNSSHGYISYAVFCLKKKIIYWFA